MTTLEQYLAPSPDLSFYKRKMEDKNMTNYEWLVKNKAELVKNILCVSIGKRKGIPERCSSISCGDCDFNSCLVWCRNNVEDWLEQEHEPLYKKGDIVIGPFNQLLLIKEDASDDGNVKATPYTDTSGLNVAITNIKKKVGHIDEPSLCASCKSEKCILPTGVAKEHCDFHKAE